MDIEKEREAFEKHASKFFTDPKEAFKTNGDQYLYDEVIWMWDCWIQRAKAQAVPEGYQLVKKELNAELMYAVAGTDDINEHLWIEQIYKGLLKAQEPANG